MKRPDWNAGDAQDVNTHRSGKSRLPDMIMRPRLLSRPVKQRDIPLIPVPNAVTAEAIEEGRKIAKDPNVKGYRDMNDLRSALEL